MTRAQAIAFVRMSMDESGEEMYSDGDIAAALDEAQVAVVRSEYRRSRKESLRKLTVVESFSSASAAASQEILFIESVMLRAGAAGVFKLKAEYVPPHRHDYTFLSTGVSKRHEYTVQNGEIITNGSAFMAAYYRVPTNAPNDVPLFLHGRVCSEATAILQRREHPNNERPTLGAIYDADELIGASKAEK